MAVALQGKVPPSLQLQEPTAWVDCQDPDALSRLSTDWNLLDHPRWARMEKIKRRPLVGESGLGEHSDPGGRVALLPDS